MPSPDGRHFVFVRTTGQNSRLLWIHSLDSDQSRSLPGTEGGIEPIWSSGRSLDRVLRRWKAQEGQPVRRAAADDRDGGGLPGWRVGRGRRHHLSGGEPRSIASCPRIRWIADRAHKAWIARSPKTRTAVRSSCRRPKVSVHEPVRAARAQCALHGIDRFRSRTASDAASIERRLCPPA